MTSTRLILSRRLAWFFGVATPLAETVRRWGTWWEYPPAFLDDFVLGGLLIAGALATRGTPGVRGRALLAGAWGFACGIAYNSVAYHWRVMGEGTPDPAPVSSEVVFGIKVAGSALFIVAFVCAVTGDE